MSENQKLGAIISGLVVVVSISAFFAAEKSGLWSELWITVLFSVFMGAAVYGLLRSSKKGR